MTHPKVTDNVRPYRWVIVPILVARG